MNGLPHEMLYKHFHEPQNNIERTDIQIACVLYAERQNKPFITRYIY